MTKTFDICAAFEAIKRYAEAYEWLDEIQHGKVGLPIGDQKTGVVAEFYARLYAVATYEDVECGSASQRGWDLRVRSPQTGQLEAVQVKAVSDYSKTRRVSPIHLSSDQGDDLQQLWLICLDKKLSLKSFKILQRSDLLVRGMAEGCVLKNKTMPIGPNTGSVELRGGQDMTEAMKDVIKESRKSGNGKVLSICEKTA